MIPLPHIHLATVKINCITLKDALGYIETLIRQKKNAVVVTPNADHIVNIQKDEAFRTIYKNADLILADGMPLIWASRFLSNPLPQRVAGSDLFPEICRISAPKGYRIFLLGGRPGAADGATKILQAKYPGLNIVGTYSPYFGFEHDNTENMKIVKMLRESRPEILLVGLGSPKQEKWIHQYKDQYCVPVSIGVGVSFEFIAGMVKRAPKWMQKSGLEWLWRLMMEPKKLWKRYLIDDMQFFKLILSQKRQQQKSHLK